MNSMDLYHLLWCHNSDLPSADQPRGEMSAAAISDGLWSDVRDDAALTRVRLLTLRPTSRRDVVVSRRSHFKGIKGNK